MHLLFKLNGSQLEGFSLEQLCFTLHAIKQIFSDRTLQLIYFYETRFSCDTFIWNHYFCGHEVVWFSSKSNFHGTINSSNICRYEVFSLSGSSPLYFVSRNIWSDSFFMCVKRHKLMWSEFWQLVIMCLINFTKVCIY